ncbi:MAG: MotA/TolQ/ExbB proton channel family protein [Planctomycetota bacterium]
MSVSTDPSDWDDAAKPQSADDGVSQTIPSEKRAQTLQDAMAQEEDADAFASVDLLRHDRVAASVGGPALPIVAGLMLAAAFYAAIYAIDWEATNRYFCGHPVALAATTLFWVAVTILGQQAMRNMAQRHALGLLRDEDLLPIDGAAPTDISTRWRQEQDAGFVARQWLMSLNQLPAQSKTSWMISRLHQLLTFQSRRQHTDGLAEEMRTLSERDADAAHDSIGLVRVIVWAIPMLGFLGTVIGITQTLGGLDFTDGNAAVDRLKSGLYVAFDTTALGLVLSVIAIFLQFPVERAHQNLLATVDHRIADLISRGLPAKGSDENPTELVATLCDGVRRAMEQSLTTQTHLWQTTIQEAQEAWTQKHNRDARIIRAAIENSLVTPLAQHAHQLDSTMHRVAEQWDRSHCDQRAAMRDEQTAWQAQWKQIGDDLTQHRSSLLQHTEVLTQAVEQQLLSAQGSVSQAHVSPEENSEAAGEQQAIMGDAMRVLARAVDTLAKRLADENQAGRMTPTGASNDAPQRSSSHRHAA